MIVTSINSIGFMYERNNENANDKETICHLLFIREISKRLNNVKTVNIIR
ncbi:MAG: hypothetical protein GXX85_10965 [Ignavibacteria bacterium]|nr:hypothetical protein [Ignavibacteria bacterium]